MWLRLTDREGNLVRINMATIERFYQESGGITSLEVGDSVYQVQESVQQIENALSSSNSPLRLFGGGWS